MAGEAIPNFVLAGAAKSGTTSLVHYLRQHPDVFVSRHKEPHYFLFKDDPPAFRGPGDDSANGTYVTDESDYSKCFDSVRNESAVGEASVFYLYQPRSIHNALEHNPDMRIVLILRDPVDRAYSAYSHLVRDGRETLDFASALDAEPARACDNWEYCWHYEAVSRYATQLAEVKALVPPSQLCVVLYEDLRRSPDAVVREIYRFLGVDESFSPNTSLRLNASGQPRSQVINRLIHAGEHRWKTPLQRVIPHRLGVWAKETLRNANLRESRVPQVDRRRLAARLAKDVVHLEGLLGRPLDDWVLG